MANAKSPQVSIVDYFKPSTADLPTRAPPLPRAISKPLFPLTDLGNAQRLAAWFGDALRYVPEWKTYLVFEDGYWHKDVGAVRVQTRAMQMVRMIPRESKLAVALGLRKQIDKWAVKSERAPYIDNMVKLAKGLPGLLLDHTKLDTNPWLLQCANGTLDLITGELIEPPRDSFITKSTRVNYDSQAKAPLWEKFLAMVIPDPSIKAFIQRLAGYCLTGLVTERVLVLFHGYGRNGKSILLHVLQAMMGDYAVTTMPTLLMSRKVDGHPSEVAHLFGARLAVTSEVKKGQAFDEEKVKRLTGNDVITARGMRQDPWSFEPTFKLMVLTNHKPTVRDSSDSIWDRILLVPFNVRIKDKDEDKGLFPKLSAELPGVLAWAVEGCRMWQQDGLQIPDAVRAVTREYRRSEDLVGRFIEERCILSPASRATAKSLHSSCSAWCRDNGLFMIHQKALSERLLEMGCTQGRTNSDRMWQGVALKADTIDANGQSSPKHAKARVGLDEIGNQILGKAKEGSPSEKHGSN